MNERTYVKSYMADRQLITALVQEYPERAEMMKMMKTGDALLYQGFRSSGVQEFRS